MEEQACGPMRVLQHVYVFITEILPSTLWVVMLTFPPCPPHLVIVRCSSDDMVCGNAAWQCCTSENGRYPCFCDNSVGKESSSNAGDPSSIPGSGRFPGEGIGYPLQYSWASLAAQTVKNPPAIWETWVQSLGWEDSLEKGTTTHSSVLAWRTPRGSQRVRHKSDFHFHFLVFVAMGSLSSGWVFSCQWASPHKKKNILAPFPLSWFTFHNLALLFTDTAGWEEFSWLHLITQGLQQSPCHPLSVLRWEGAADPLLGGSTAEPTCCPTSTVSGWGWWLAASLIVSGSLAWC